jgi:hypothetical protein
VSGEMNEETHGIKTKWLVVSGEQLTTHHPQLAT